MLPIGMFPWETPLLGGKGEGGERREGGREDSVLFSHLSPLGGGDSNLTSY